MGIIKITASKSGTGALENYLKQEHKTEELLISGKNCSGNHFARDFAITRNINNQMKGRQHYHIVQSFKPGEGTPEQIHAIGLKFARSDEFKGYQVAIVTHKDRDHLHNHIVVNAVNFDTGKKYISNAKSLYRLRELSNDLTREAGLTVPEKGKELYTERSFNIAKHKVFEKAKENKVKSYVLDTYKDFTESMKSSTSKKMFLQKMENKGYSIKINDEKKPDGNWKNKNITFEKDGKKVRMSNLSKTFLSGKMTREQFEGIFVKKQEKALKSEPEKKQDIVEFIELTHKRTKEKMFLHKKENKILSSKLPDLTNAKPFQWVVFENLKKALDFYKKKGYSDKEIDTSIEKRTIIEFYKPNKNITYYLEEVEKDGIVKVYGSIDKNRPDEDKKRYKSLVEGARVRMIEQKFDVVKREIFEDEKLIPEKTKVYNTEEKRVFKEKLEEITREKEKELGR